MVLLVAQRPAVLPGEMAVVLSSHATLFFINPSLLMLKMRGFPGCELAIRYTLADAVLLILFALIDISLLRISSGSGLGENADRREDKGCGEGENFNLHGESSCIDLRRWIAAAVRKE